MDKYVIRTKQKRVESTDGAACTSAAALRKSTNARFKPDLYQNPAAGHQIGDSRARKAYFEARNFKLEQQKPKPVSAILRGVTIHVNGYIGGIGDLEFRQLVQKHGGTLSMHLGLRTVTHMVCTSLCATKTGKIMRAGTSVKVVRPELVIESIRNGRRLPESRYSILHNEGPPIVSKPTHT